jgi:signal transduction histidine kinase
LKTKKERLVKEEKNLMQKANDLLDEAYHKVRNFAHVEDAAASISEGLVNSVTNLAIRITQSENLIVDVHETGSYKELAKNVEKDLFRVVKELITNVMKHAEASEINIEFTYSEKNLNIIVEDNGKGFNVEILNMREGMGLDAVNKKISDLQGKMIIESVKNNGTTIIIDIPTA